MGNREVRAAWLAVADACERVHREIPDDAAETVLTHLDAAVGTQRTGWSSTYADTAAAIRAMCGPDEDEAPAADGFRDPRVDPRPDDVLLVRGIATQEAARAEVERLRRHWDRQTDRWCVHVPEQSPEWFDTRAAAEAFAVEWMTDYMQDAGGEPHDDQCVILAVVSTTEEVVGATADDGSERAEWLRGRKWDYEITGYRVTPGQETYIREDVEHPAAAKAQAEVARLNRVIAVDRGDETQAPTGWKLSGDGCWVHNDHGPIFHTSRSRAPSERVVIGSGRWWKAYPDGILRWPSALEAMEAIDAERGAPHA